MRLLVLLCLTSAVHAQSWERLSDAEAKALGWSREKLAAAKSYTADLHTEAVVIIANGKVLEEWGAVEQKFNAHSIRKSFISALFGIRVAEGSLNLAATMRELKIDDNEPRLTEVEKNATVHDLLKARSGIYHPALYETARMKAARPQRYSHEPGSFWYYNNWDFNALGTIYEQQTGAGIYADLERLLAKPLGMEHFSAADGSYVTGADSIHRAYPFRITARDMARFGQLFLQKGKWNGKQVVPEQWVQDSVRSHSDAGTSGGYGYLWWTERSGIHLPGITTPPGSYSARGAGGHYMLVVPEMDLVIVHRVNTDKAERRVESAQFAGLVRHIWSAYTPGKEVPLATRMALLMTKHRVPGAAVLQIKDHTLAEEVYLGAREAGKGAAVDKHTLFEAASMTKPLAAYAAMQLVAAGKLDLDRPLVSYLGKPYLTDEPQHEAITARMVLHHSTGLPNWRPDGEPLRVLKQPGSEFTYSGEGFLFLQRVMERITGKDLESQMQDALLKPLKMTHSSLVWQPTRAANAAAGHDDKGSVKKNRKLYKQPNAAYTLYTTAQDYARFVLEMMKPTQLSSELAQQMMQPAGPEIENGERYGLGWRIASASNGVRVKHSGSNGTGFRSYVEFSPNTGSGLIILTNATSGAKFWEELATSLAAP